MNGNNSDNSGMTVIVTIIAIVAIAVIVYLAVQYMGRGTQSPTPGTVVIPPGSSAGVLP